MSARISEEPLRATRPVVVLGVRRSGTTLLRTMLTQHSGLAIPPESYFVLPLWLRHGERPDRDAFLRDVGRLEEPRKWGLDRSVIARFLPAQPTFAAAIQAVYRAYADKLDKARFGDKTPAYMRDVELLERAFPGAQYVHIVRDGRDAGLSYLQRRRFDAVNWARPRSLGAFAAQWCWEVENARQFAAEALPGRYVELAYERLVRAPEASLRELCAFLEMEFEPAMLEYHRAPEPALARAQPRLAEEPSPGRADWRERMKRSDIERFEAVAGRTLAALGYDRTQRLPRRACARAAGTRLAYDVRARSWDLALACTLRAPLAVSEPLSRFRGRWRWRGAQQL